MKRSAYVFVITIVIISFLAITTLIIYKIYESHGEIKYEKEQISILKSKLKKE
jgi:hypothetical protein